MSRNAFLGLKRVFFDRIFERSYWTWRKHPAIMIPSMLQAALSLILQSVVTLAVMLLLINDPANPQLALLLASILSPNSGLVGVLLNPALRLTNIPLSTAVVVSLLLDAVLGGVWVYSSEYGMSQEGWSSEYVRMSSALSTGFKGWKPMA